MGSDPDRSPKRWRARQESSSSLQEGGGISRSIFLRSSLVGGAMAFAALVAPSAVRPAWGGAIGHLDTTRTLGMKPAFGADLPRHVEAVRALPEVQEVFADDEIRTASLRTDAMHSMLHHLPDGSTMRLSAFAPNSERPDVLAVVKEYSVPQNHVWLDARTWRVTPDGALQVEKMSLNGGPGQQLWGSSGVSSENVPCGNCSTSSRLYEGRGCTKIDPKACATCVGCAACVGATTYGAYVAVALAS